MEHVELARGTQGDDLPLLALVILDLREYSGYSFR